MAWRVIAARRWRSIRQQHSSAMNWQQNSASMRAGAFERDGGGVVDGLQLVVALFEVGLVAVGEQDVGVGEGVVVADQREAAVRRGVVADLVGVDGDLECVAGRGELAVAGVLARSSALLLAVALLLVLADGDG